MILIEDKLECWFDLLLRSFLWLRCCRVICTVDSLEGELVVIGACSYLLLWMICWVKSYEGVFFHFPTVEHHVCFLLSLYGKGVP